ncbi:PilZ domain-containing protein [Cyanobium sp. Morenito 9A2]|uniref:PilZ domain-containing protein n=1 Tax=Cyanobium sp. Morenito 9A2 TaxID=2823718 RepID=UPI0020CEAF98|nr:PilZ domain-containing protein [Cyanobium sp. Morenito 9A2]MCP9848820.1 PilZ domain-containing protein [Cyanobium sp. Morenito 9A2]
MTGSGPEIPRRHKRYLLPSSMAVVAGDFSPSDGGETLEGKLWDISPLGTCLVVPIARAVVVGDRGALRIVDPHSEAELTLAVEVRWIEPAPQVTFMGLVFSSGRFPKSSFLEPYFKTSWVDAMKVRRLDDLR